MTHQCYTYISQPYRTARLLVSPNRQMQKVFVLPGIIPKGRKFPFAMRLTSDVLADDGAAAMTAVSSATLAFANAGIPLSAPVAGVPSCSAALVHILQMNSTSRCSMRSSRYY